MVKKKAIKAEECTSFCVTLFHNRIFSMHFNDTVPAVISLSHLFGFLVLLAAYKCKIDALLSSPMQVVMLNSAVLV